MNAELYDGLDDNAQQAAAVSRLFEILQTEESSHEFADEVKSLLKRFPQAAQTLSPNPYYPLYPLHVACLKNAPISIIHALLTAWPDGVQTRPWNDGPLPLHDACVCGKSLPTIQLLVEAWPESVKQRGRTGIFDPQQLPLYYALENADVSYKIIEYLVQQWPQSAEYDSQAAFSPLQWACHFGVSLPMFNSCFGRRLIRSSTLAIEDFLFTLPANNRKHPSIRWCSFSMRGQML